MPKHPRVKILTWTNFFYECKFLKHVKKIIEQCSGSYCLHLLPSDLFLSSNLDSLPSALFAASSCRRSGCSWCLLSPLCLDLDLCLMGADVVVVVGAACRVAVVVGSDAISQCALAFCTLSMMFLSWGRWCQTPVLVGSGTPHRRKLLFWCTVVDH